MQRTYETIPSNPALSGLICVQHDVVFAGEQHADLIVPCKPEGQCLPAIVFIQGSAWCFPDRYRQLPSLAGFAKMGLVVMTITHRNCMEGHPFPAFLQDSKAAVRFLRAHAEEYGVDPERIGVWGTSSGGNTAQLIGLTPNAPCYRTADWANVSDSVSCVVSCFGPTDVPELVWGARASQQPELIRIVQGLTPQCAEPQASYEAMSPIYLPLNAPPPFLLLHGDRDTVVPYTQSERMAARLWEHGCEAQLVRVAGADHEGDFWSDMVYERIAIFLRQTLHISGF